MKYLLVIKIWLYPKVITRCWWQQYFLTTICVGCSCNVQFVRANEHLEYEMQKCSDVRKTKESFWKLLRPAWRYICHYYRDCYCYLTQDKQHSVGGVKHTKQLPLIEVQNSTIKWLVWCFFLNGTLLKKLAQLLKFKGYLNAALSRKCNNLFEKARVNTFKNIWQLWSLYTGVKRNLDLADTTGYRCKESFSTNFPFWTLSSILGQSLLFIPMVRGWAA